MERSRLIPAEQMVIPVNNTVLEIARTAVDTFATEPVSTVFEAQQYPTDQNAYMAALKSDDLKHNYRMVVASDQTPSNVRAKAKVSSPAMSTIEVFNIKPEKPGLVQRLKRQKPRVAEKFRAGTWDARYQSTGPENRVSIYRVTNGSAVVVQKTTSHQSQASREQAKKERRIEKDAVFNLRFAPGSPRSQRYMEVLTKRAAKHIESAPTSKNSNDAKKAKLKHRIEFGIND